MFEEETWRDCPMILEYERCRKAYMKELRKRAWRRGQERKLYSLAVWTVSGETEEAREYWAEWLFRTFSRRFSRHEKTEWIPFLAGMTDVQVCGSYQNEKMKTYCIRFRDAARVSMNTPNEHEFKQEETWKLANAS